MKSYLIALMVAVAATVLGTSELNAAPKRLKGSGKIITKELPAPTHYRSVRASRGVEVLLVPENGQTMKIEADDNVMEYIVAEVKGGVLILTIDDDVRTISSIHAKITAPTNGKLTALHASSAAKIESEMTLTADEIEVGASSAAKIRAKINAKTSDFELSSAANIKAEVIGGSCSIEATSSANFKGTLAVRHCEIEASSAADVTLEGAALVCEAELSSAADLQASKFAVKRYSIEASSAADADILCLEQLNASASSGADITYIGNCEQRSIKGSSGGSVSKR